MDAAIAAVESYLNYIFTLKEAPKDFRLCIVTAPTGHDCHIVHQIAFQILSPLSAFYELLTRRIHEANLKDLGNSPSDVPRELISITLQILKSLMFRHTYKQNQMILFFKFFFQLFIILINFPELKII